MGYDGGERVVVKEEEGGGPQCQTITGLTSGRGRGYWEKGADYDGVSTVRREGQLC